MSIPPENVRPTTLIYLIFFLTIIVSFDSRSENFNVDEAYISLIKSLLLLVFFFVFGGREVQKMILNKKKNEGSAHSNLKLFPK